MRRTIAIIAATLAVVAAPAASADLLQSPAGGPYFGKLDPSAHYYVKIDNTGEGIED